MPRSVGNLVKNNFSKGLITEAALFNFPESACKETFNCIHMITGAVKRRRGYDFETDYVLKSLTRSSTAICSFIWKAVGGDGTLDILVIQFGSTLYFWSASSSGAISASSFADTVDLTAFSPSSAPSPSDVECQFTSGNGKLFVSHPNLESFSVEYDPATLSFTATQIDLTIRDFEGVDDGLDVDARVVATMGTITQAHYYNLRNQGWTDTNLNTWDTGGSTLDNTGTYIAIPGRDDLPSNSDVMWSFNNSQDVFDIGTVPNRARGNSPAPKGHYILNAYSKDRQTASGILVGSDSAGYQRASTIAFFSGRLFFSGTNFIGRNSEIYFTQVIERDEQLGQCYQVNDPTSDATFDLLPTDGGVIKIQDAGVIYKLFPVAGALIVFASNGVWSITGSTGLGFTANDYNVSKLSAISTTSATSFVDVAGVPMWWNLEGIYRLEGSQSGYQVTSITNTTIQTYYDAIPATSKRDARGFYNSSEYTIKWLFRSTASTTTDNKYEYDRILSIDIRTAGVYIWTIPTHDVKIHGLFSLENIGSSTPAFKYITSYYNVNDKLTFSEEINTDYLDWFTYDSTGTDYESYFISGYSVPNPLTDFQSNYILLYNDVDSKYNIQGQWDFTNTGNSGRWSNTQIIDTTSNTNYDSFITKRKIRGRGKALQIKVSSYTGEPFTINGWGVYVTGNQIP